MNTPSSNGVSVIIPCFNNAGCISRAIRSALQQAVHPLEIIVVNDGSTDESEEVVRRFGGPVACINQTNSGPAAARNRGLREANENLIAFLDADDYWLPGFLPAAVKFLDDHPDAIAVSAGVRCIVGNGEVIELPGFVGRPGSESKTPCVLNNFFSFWSRFDHLRTGSSLMRKSAIDKAGGQRSDLWMGEDLEYWAYLGTFGRWGFIPEIFWVGDPEPQAARTGWLAKYSRRRHLCPTVEQWQERILPRLTAPDRPGFEIIRGRVAANLAQSHVLAGRDPLSRSIVRQYGGQMPRTWLSRLLIAGDRFGALSWQAACLLVRCREWQKAAARAF